MPQIPSPPIIALLSDMGYSDWYVGTMKGVALAVCPNAHLVDICHDVTKQSIQEASFMLHVSHGYFPAGTIFLCVVDPEVGSIRQPLIARNERFYFIGPNNGTLTLVQAHSQEWEARVIENPAYMLGARSQTFHGRDIFAPAAGHLAFGADFQSFGRVIEDTVRIPHIEKVEIKDRKLSGRIVYIDSYGNLLTNVTPDMLPDEMDPHEVRLLFRGHRLKGIAPHYAAVPLNHPLMYWGSSGILEVAINYGSAERKWNVQVGEWFELEW